MKFIGVDIAKAAHCAAAIDEQGRVVMTPVAIPQTQQGLQAFESRLQALGNKDEIKIGLEATGHYWKILWRFLTPRGWKVEVMNPVLSAANARSNLRGRQTDADDALVIAKVLRDGGYAPWVEGTPQIEELKVLCHQRRWLVKQLAAAKKRLLAQLDELFPEFARQFKDPYGKTALAILKEAPSARLLATLPMKRLTHLLVHHSHNHFGAVKAQALHQAARNSVATTHVLPSLEFCLQSMIQQVEFLEAQIEKLQSQITTNFKTVEHPIQSIPGIGKVTGPVILSEIGDIQRFCHPKGAHKILAFAGMDPRIRASGQWQGKVKMSKRGSPTLRTALYQAASMARIHHPFFKAIYRRQKDEFKKLHAVAISHVARKLVEVIYAVWISNQNFDPAKLCPNTP